jgi:hypothetical protein
LTFRPLAGIGLLDHLAPERMGVEQMRQPVLLGEEAAMAGIGGIGEDQHVAGPGLGQRHAVHGGPEVLDEALALGPAAIGSGVVVGEAEPAADQHHEPGAVDALAGAALVPPGHAEPGAAAAKAAARFGLWAPVPTTTGMPALTSASTPCIRSSSVSSGQSPIEPQ